MNVLRNVGLIIVGMVLVLGLLVGARVALADGGKGGMNGMGGQPGMGGGHMGLMGGNGHMIGPRHGMGGFQGVMAGHGRMGMMNLDMYGEGMPEACIEMMDDPEMMGHMMQMMHGEEPMSPAECQAWMTEHEVPAEMQAECLAHMAEHHQP